MPWPLRRCPPRVGMSWEETQSHSRKAKRKFDERQSGSEGWNGMEWNRAMIENRLVVLVDA